MISYADIAFLGGPVHVGTADRSRVGGLAVRDGLVVALGQAATRELVGPRTEVVDLTGGLLIPGFQDAHVHPIQGGIELASCDLSQVRTEPEYLAVIRAYADARPAVKWITGGGWAMEAFPGGLPTRAALDSVVPDRPVYLPNADHHGVWVNSVALRIAGITATTPDPPDGRIERDAAGEPTGMLQEGAADLVGRHVPHPTAEQMRHALRLAQARQHSYGVTAWQDAWVGPGLGLPDVLPTYLDAAAAGDLTARVRGALWWQRDRGLEQLDELRARREAAARALPGRFDTGAVKMMLDGVAENHTAAMLSPYVDGCGSPSCRPGEPGHELDTAGLAFIDPDALPGYVTALDREGFSVHFHALGDRAVRLALDAVAAARAANGWSDARHQLAHIQVVHPDDRPRFRELGVAANIQALWAAHEVQLDELTIPYLGAERAAWQYPFGDLQRSGAILAAGSDWPVSSADPIQAIHVAVNRILPGAADASFLPEQRVDLGSALAAYTAGSAWANGFDDTGVLRVGAPADLALLDRDPFAHPPEEIAATRVTTTFVSGVRVHS
jgi:predicted amidohydrolase YtcJ